MDAEATPETAVREHVARHDSVGDLPLVTESARVTVRGPYGELVLGEPSQRDTVFLATGTGVGARLDPANVDVYACGINAMVHSLVLPVERLGVPPERIESEGFG